MVELARSKYMGTTDLLHPCRLKVTLHHTYSYVALVQFAEYSKALLYSPILLLYMWLERGRASLASSMQYKLCDIQLQVQAVPQLVHYCRRGANDPVKLFFFSIEKRGKRKGKRYVVLTWCKAHVAGFFLFFSFLEAIWFVVATTIRHTFLLHRPYLLQTYFACQTLNFARQAHCTHLSYVRLCVYRLKGRQNVRVNSPAKSAHLHPHILVASEPSQRRLVQSCLRIP